MLPEAPRCLQKLPNAPRCLRGCCSVRKFLILLGFDYRVFNFRWLKHAPRISQEVPEAVRCCLELPESSRCSQKLPMPQETYRCFADSKPDADFDSDAHGDYNLVSHVDSNRYSYAVLEAFWLRIGIRYRLRFIFWLGPSWILRCRFRFRFWFRIRFGSDSASDYDPDLYFGSEVGSGFGFGSWFRSNTDCKRLPLELAVCKHAHLRIFNLAVKVLRWDRFL